MSKKKPDLYDLFNDESLWGTQETESLSHEEIMRDDWNRVSLYRDKTWQNNIAEARRKQAKDPDWHKKMKDGLDTYLSSEEGKKNRKLQGVRNKQNPVFRRNVLLGRKELPFRTPWGYYDDANLGSEESRTKNTSYLFETRLTDKTYCSPARLRKLLRDDSNSDFTFITWQEYDAIMNITDLPQELD